MQALPLALVVAFETARVGAFSGRLELDESGQGVAQRHRVVRARALGGQRRFADRHHGAGRQPQHGGHIGDQPLERGAQLVFRFASSRYVRQLRLG